jgi:hypothetical protein
MTVIPGFTHGGVKAHRISVSAGKEVYVIDPDKLISGEHERTVPRPGLRGVCLLSTLCEDEVAGDLFVALTKPRLCQALKHYSQSA